GGVVPLAGLGTMSEAKMIKLFVFAASTLRATTLTTRASTAGLVISLVVMLTACGGSAQQTRASLGFGYQSLKPGTYVLDLLARSKEPGQAPSPVQVPKIEITLPAGWFNYKGRFVVKGHGLPHRTGVSFWDVAQVYPTPCQWKGKAMVDPGRSVDGLVAALLQQPLRNATTPTDVALAGLHGKYLQWSVPTNINFQHCDEGYFESWTAQGWASDRYQQKPGQVDRLWILNMHGQRFVVDAWYLPEASSQDRAELERVVKSIRFR
ncbi:MAG: hypothetical protein M3R54_05280, partial [Chloroflexota bacterium]|nr:hypothetical protein [Chloroflexota bacterium]